MKIERLRINGLRCLSDVDLVLDSSINVFIGDNGAGKTSVLEAAYLLSHAGSFRRGAKEALLQRGASRFSIFGELLCQGDRLVRLGLGREISRWESKLDGDNVPIGELVRHCAVVCFEPGSHGLISGAADERRRFLDWGVFHVEHEFLFHWRRYQRALKQRNSLLRSSNVNEAMLEPWEIELTESASHIDEARQSYFERLQPHLSSGSGKLLPELGAAITRYRRGWSEGESLQRIYREQRAKDRARGHTTAGPHRADWSIAFEHAPQREHLSRGQEKLTALVCVLAQAELHASSCGDQPIVCLDDLASELDEVHQIAVVEQLHRSGAQVLLTGTEIPRPLSGQSVAVFHVEQGKVSQLL